MLQVANKTSLTHLGVTHLGVTMIDSSDICVIYQQPLSQLNDGERVDTWLCAHRYHSYCTGEYLRIKGGNPDNVPCPQCHITTNQALRMQNNVGKGIPHSPPSISPLHSASENEEDDYPSPPAPAKASSTDTWLPSQPAEATPAPAQPAPAKP